ncbi:hypothetical protein IW146_005825 [Coemansia sp. RSA 922]|nr:hypothetical protein GGI09_004800 [Coemansia sp. S100]KAJ2110628.1 hypothetical protein IW146_005825 [Coemansia sp. RSA 922]
MNTGSATTHSTASCNFPRTSTSSKQTPVLKRNMIQKFGKRLIMVCGNWSASMVRFHAPIRGRGWRKKFKRIGFSTYLFDEFRTSKTCPGCDGDLHKCKVIDNPWTR